MKIIYFLIGFMLMISLGIGETSVPFYTRLVITQGSAELNEEFVLTHSLKALTDLPETRMIFEIPNGVELIDGIPAENVNPIVNDSIPFSVTLKITHPGAYCITCHTIIAPRDTIFLFQHFAQDIYIISDADTAIISDTSLTGPYYNLYSGSVMGEIPGELPPEGTNYMVSGTVRYRNKLTNQLDPLPDIKVVLDGWHYRDSTYTLADGQYSITAPAGEYDIIICAINRAGEVHNCWHADIDFLPVLNADLYCSPFPRSLHAQEINLYSNLIINYDAEDSEADRARILWRLRRDKLWMYYHTSPHRTLDYIEVSYPAEIYIDYPWPWSDETFYLEATPFYVYFDKLEDVDVKAHDYTWLGWIGVAVSYRNPHQIVINDFDDIWDPTDAIGGLSHEWTHGLMVAILGGKMPYDWGHALHWYDYVLNTGHTFSEGFAEFCAPALWVEELGQSVDPPTRQLEWFYGNPRHSYLQPWYKGRYLNNTNGSFVEGAVMQFFWDLYEDRNTNDHEQDFDDDGVYGGMAKIINTLNSLGTIMTAETSNRDTLGNEHGDTIIFTSKKAHFPGPNYDFIGKYKQKWEELGYGSITELYSVDIHPFEYLQPYAVPAPSNLSRTINHVQKKVTLNWHDNTTNEGAFFISRNLNNSGYILHHTCPIPNTTSFTEDIQEGNSYKYKVRAFTCDTSGYSNEITISTYVAAPTGITVTEISINQVCLTWQDNSSVERGFKVARKVDDGDWNENYMTVVGIDTTEVTDTISFLHEYLYKIRAYDSLSNYSDWSNEKAFTSGLIAQSQYPGMSAFNSNRKVARGSDGKIHVIYWDGEDIYYNYSTDDGLTFDLAPWEEVGASDTIPALAVSNTGNAYIVYGVNVYVGGGSPPYKIKYYIGRRTESGWEFSYYPVYQSSYTNSTTMPYPPALVLTSDSGYVAYKDAVNGTIRVSRFTLPWGVSINSVQVAASGNSYPGLGYSSWSSISIPNCEAYGAPSLRADSNEIRLAFEGYDAVDGGVIFVRLPWTGKAYICEATELVSDSTDWSANGMVGYTYLAAKDVVVWKYNDDIWYARRTGSPWTAPVNLSNTGLVSSYPQGIVFSGLTCNKLLTLWTEELEDYYLVRRITNLYVAPLGPSGPQGGDLSMPRPFTFERIAPNPVCGVLRLSFYSPDERLVKVRLYDVTGRLIDMLFQGRARIGQNEITSGPRGLAAGVYFLDLTAGEYRKVERVVFLK